MPNIRLVTLVLSKDKAMNGTFIKGFRSPKNLSLRTVAVRVHGDSDCTSKGRIVNVFQENGGGVFQVESLRDVSGALDVNIEFT